MSTTKVPKYNVGDIVKLNAGGPDMSIRYVKKDYPSREFLGAYTCQWFAGKKLDEGEFKEESLVLVRKQSEQSEQSEQTDGNESGT